MKEAENTMMPEYELPHLGGKLMSTQVSALLIKELTGGENQFVVLKFQIKTAFEVDNFAVDHRADAAHAVDQPLAFEIGERVADDGAADA